MPASPNVTFISGELRLGSVSVQVGIARDINGRGYVTGGFGGTTALIDAGPVETSAVALIAAGIVAIAGAKASINVGGSYEPIEKFIDINNPSVTFAVHNVVGFQGDITGNTLAFTFGPGFVLPGYQVSTQTGAPIGYIPSFSDTARMTLYMLLRAGGLSNSQIFDTLGIQKCFLADTLISMADGSQKFIKEINVGDSVCSFNCDASKILYGKSVKRTFSAIASQIIDLRGLRCTPGHVFLTGDIDACSHGRFATIASVLRDDRTIVQQDGTVLRARTGAALGACDDNVVEVVYRDHHTGSLLDNVHRAVVRAGIPMPGTVLYDGAASVPRTLAQHLEAHGVTILSDGSLCTSDGARHIACNWPEGSTPFDTHEARNWIVEVDGQPYTPPWIRDLVEEDETQGLRVVGAMPTVAGTTSITPAPL